MFYAHTYGSDENQWEPLPDHLHEVRDTAGGFAAKFGAADWGGAVGLLHDLGKAKEPFLKYLRGGSPASHATEGAKWVEQNYPLKSSAQLLTYCIAGHHAGLANGVNFGGGTTPLGERLKNCVPIPLPEGIAAPPQPGFPPLFAADSFKALDPSGRAFATHFFVRMLFSCLVDADFLATETFYASREGRDVERGWRGDLADLAARLETHLTTLKSARDDVGAVRGEVVAACRERAHDAPGLFTLTVPTGGGKTFSSLAFALEHAKKHKLDRVIYVIPFTSIIEQTAGVFRDALKDDDAILEHHSAFDWDRNAGDEKDDEGRDGLAKLRRAAENWDRPIVITTAVQLFESLFANRTSRCRKLHNLSRAVLILDEAQTLPLKILRPCLAALRELARGYGSSVVLCTATQPAILTENGFGAPEAWSIKDKHSPVREITPDPHGLHERLRRVSVNHLGVVEDDALIRRLKAENQALCIVNSRPHAKALFEMMKGEDCFHLTTSMTAAHRRKQLEDIRALLKDESKPPVRVIATSLIEAGVDVDFPVVFRAMAGVDSIAQAAGRCNRENKLGRDGGRVFVFTPGPGENRAPPREVKQFADVAEPIVNAHADPLSQAAVTAYFNELYWRRGDDQLDALKIGDGDSGLRGVMNAITQRAPGGDFPFADIAAVFRVIEDAQAPVIIPDTDGRGFGADEALLDELKNEHRPFVNAATRRKLQQFSVQIPRKARHALIADGFARVVREKDYGDQFVLLTDAARYSPESGLDWRSERLPEIDALIL
jgi:CRISPR-associated endonuclease/helicase Cas3